MLPQEKITKPQPSSAPPADLTREYVAGQNSWTNRIGQVLSNFVDDLEWIIGSDVYERMSKDPCVSKNIQFQKLSVTSEELYLRSAIPDKENPEFDLANEIKDFHTRSLAGLHRPLSQIIGEMMAALKRGHSVAEVTYKEPTATGGDKYKLLLKSIKVKPRNSTAFVIDEFRNVLGLTTWLYGGRRLVSSSEARDGQKVIPLEKFAVLAFDTEDEDPRGINPLRPAYNFWQGKCLVPGLHLKWLEKSGLPSVVGFTAEEAQHEGGTAEEGLQTAQEVMAEKLSALENGASAAFPYGATIEVVEVKGTGLQFSRAYTDFDGQIDYALSLQSGATKDSQKGSYSSKRIQKDVLDILIWSRKQCVAQVLQGVLYNGTRYNFGEDKSHLTPHITIGDEEGRDFATDANAAAQIGPYLTDSQWLKLLKEIGIASPEEGEILPPRVKAAPQPKGDPENPDPDLKKSKRGRETK